MVNIASKTKQMATPQTLCELMIWNPPQGSLPEAIPISIDLDFDTEEIHLPTMLVEVRASKATIHLTLIDADMIRGSRLGEHVHKPDFAAEVTQCVRQAIETEGEQSGKLEVEVKKGFLGRIFAAVSWKRRRSKKSEYDHVLKLESRVDRIVPRTAGRWLVVEPIKPFLLRGRYVGSNGTEEIGPLCMITMRERKSKVVVAISVRQEDLDVKAIKKQSVGAVSRNKEIVIAQLVRRSISRDQTMNAKLPMNFTRDELVLAQSMLEIETDEV